MSLLGKYLISAHYATLVTSNTNQIAIVGAGISGLSAAWALRQAGRECVVLEAEERCGGIIETRRGGGFVCEGGPDSFLSAKPEAEELCRELGLEAEMIATEPHNGSALIMDRGRLVPFPNGWGLLGPRRLGPLLRSPLLGTADKAALAMRWRRQAAPPREEETVAGYLERRYGRRAGRALAHNIASPLLAGVYGAGAGQIRAAGRKQTARISFGPQFESLRGGMGALVDCLAERLGERLRLHCRVQALEAVTGGYRLELEGGGQLEAAAVIVALPAAAAAGLLAPLDAALAAPLAEIPYASSVNINLGFGRAPALPPGHGFLAGRGAAPLLACTFASQKFAGRAPAGGALLRLFYGKDVAATSDEHIAARAHTDVASLLAITQTANYVQVRRTPQALPLYTPGHGARVARMQEALARHPRLALAGNAYSGVGVPDCIASGRAAAARVQAGLG